MKKRIYAIFGVMILVLACFLPQVFAADSDKTEEELYAPIIEKYITALQNGTNFYNEKDLQGAYLMQYHDLDHVGYHFQDFDENGTKELVLYQIPEESEKVKIGQLYALYTIKDGKVVHLEQVQGVDSTQYYLINTEGNGYGFHVVWGGARNDNVYAFRNGELILADQIKGDGIGDGECKRSTNGDSFTILSKEEYLNLIHYYDNARVAVNGTPLSEYGRYQDYDELLQTYIKAINEKWSKDKLTENGLALILNFSLDDIGYSFKDINNDGQDELFIYLYNDPTKVLAIYTKRNSAVSCVLKTTNQDTTFYYCSDNLIKAGVVNGGNSIAMYFYRFNTNSVLSLIEQIDEENGTYYSYDSNNQKKTITKDEYDKIIAKYPVQTISGKRLSEYNTSLQELTFTYGNNNTVPCYFSKDYFANSSYEYNQSLGTMSLALAWSSFGVRDENADDSEAYKNASKNAKKLLMDIGVQENKIYVNPWFEQKPTADTIGFIAGNMPIDVNGENYTLIAVGIRGGGYEREWASNFTIGEEGQHQGFEKAKNDVFELLKGYIQSQNITGKVKFWITGFSRGGATTNLVAGQLDEERSNGKTIVPNIEYELSDIYAYCFEPPKGAVGEDLKELTFDGNIFNIVNRNDLVPRVAMSQEGFGFARYGVDRYLPIPEIDSKYYSDKKSAMTSILYSLPTPENVQSKLYKIDDFKMKKFAFNKSISKDEDDPKLNYSQGIFLDSYLNCLTKEIFINRDNYVNSYQDDLRTILSTFMGSDEELSVFGKSFFNKLKSEWSELILRIGLRSFGSDLPALFETFEKVENLSIIRNTVYSWMNSSLAEAGITDYNEKELNQAVDSVVNLLIPVFISHPNYFATAVSNFSSIGQAHTPEVCFAWMASMDENYVDGAMETFNNGSYRVLRANCDVDVNVTDSLGNIIAAIVNEEPQEIDGRSTVSSINEEGEKIIILPVDEDYRLTVTAREDGDVNIGINEFSSVVEDFVRVVNYYDIPLEKGKSITGVIPAYSNDEIENDTGEGSTVNYSLTNQDEEIIEENSDLSGEEASEAYYHVTISTNNEEYGYVIGGGLFQLGSFAQVQAIAEDHCSFDGWYEGDILVSQEETYRFAVKKDTNLIAKFSKNNDAQDDQDIDNDKTPENPDKDDSNKPAPKKGSQDVAQKGNVQSNAATGLNDVSSNAIYIAVVLLLVAVAVIIYVSRRRNNN